MELCFIKRKVSNIVFELLVSGYKKISDQLIWIQKLMEGLWKRNSEKRVLHMVRIS